MKKVLFITYGGGHVNTLIPVIKELKKNVSLNINILALSTAPVKLQSENMDYISLKDISNKEIIELGYSYANEYHNNALGIEFNDTAAYYGIGIRDLIIDHGKIKALKLFKKSGRKAFFPKYFLKEFLLENNADVIVTTSAPRFEEAAIIAADELQIPTIRIEHLFSPRNPYIPSDVYHCVMNNFVKNKLLNKGIERKKIIITGQPAFDHLFTNKYQNVTVLKEKYHVLYKDNVITWISPGNTDQKDIIMKLIEIEKKVYNTQIIIKLHPNEDGKIQSDLIEEFKSNILIFKENLQEILLISSLIITEFSAVGIEAIIFNKPLITINLTNQPDRVSYAENGVALSVNCLDDLEGCILTMHEKDHLFKQARSKFYKEKKAAKKVVNVIEKVINNEYLK